MKKYQLMKFLNLLILQQLLPNQFLLKMLSLLWQHRQMLNMKRFA